MLSAIAKLLLTITAIAPVLLVMALMAWLEDDGWWSIGLFAGGIFLPGVGFLVFVRVQRHLERLRISVVAAEPADKDNMAVLILYLTPLLRLRLDDFNWPIWLATVTIIVILLSFSNSYPVNPILNLLGWHSFNARTNEGITYTLVTRTTLQNVNRSLTVVQLTDYLLVEVQGT